MDILKLLIEKSAAFDSFRMTSGLPNLGLISLFIESSGLGEERVKSSVLRLSKQIRDAFGRKSLEVSYDMGRIAVC